MPRTLLTTSLALCLSLLGCGADDESAEGAAGELDEACIGGLYCNGDLVCVAGVCTPSGGTGDGDGDGDSGSGETGDGDGDSGSGDTAAPLGLYEGPCLTSDECEGELMCASQNGRYWCASACEDDMSCPAHASASATPTCEFLYINDDGNMPMQACVLLCEAEEDCPEGSQCFGSGLASKLWCGFLLP